MAERYWSIDDCCWVDCPEIPEQAAAAPAEAVGPAAATVAEEPTPTTA